MLLTVCSFYTWNFFLLNIKFLPYFFLLCFKHIGSIPLLSQSDNNLIFPLQVTCSLCFLQTSFSLISVEHVLVCCSFWVLNSQKHCVHVFQYIVLNVILLFGFFQEIFRKIQLLVFVVFSCFSFLFSGALFIHMLDLLCLASRFVSFTQKFLCLHIIVFKFSPIVFFFS